MSGKLLFLVTILFAYQS
uniref:Truncated S1 variant n=1 Tax=Infectious bronchitis virus TaxID=11120 RepID=A0SXL7_9GAMC|nr:truncated S1 variant [Infectious bronchitis virus]